MYVFITEWSCLYLKCLLEELKELSFHKEFYVDCYMYPFIPHSHFHPSRKQLSLFSVEQPWDKLNLFNVYGFQPLSRKELSDPNNKCASVTQHNLQSRNSFQETKEDPFSGEGGSINWNDSRVKGHIFWGERFSALCGRNLCSKVSGCPLHKHTKPF